MISAIKKAVFLNQMRKVLVQNDVTVLHYIRGRVRLASPKWKEDTVTLRRLLKELQNEERIISVKHTKETGSLLITYNPEPVNNEGQIEQWFQKIQQILNGRY